MFKNKAKQTGKRLEATASHHSQIPWKLMLLNVKLVLCFPCTGYGWNVLMPGEGRGAKTVLNSTGVKAFRSRSFGYLLIVQADF